MQKRGNSRGYKLLCLVHFGTSIYTLFNKLNIAFRHWFYCAIFPCHFRVTFDNFSKQSASTGALRMRGFLNHDVIGNMSTKITLAAKMKVAWPCKFILNTGPDIEAVIPWVIARKKHCQANNWKPKSHKINGIRWIRDQVNSGPSELGTKWWIRDQIFSGPGEFGTKHLVNSGPNIFGTRWIRDQTLGEFGTKFFLSYKYVTTGISYLVWVPFPTYFIQCSSIMICIFVLNLWLFCIFLAMIECALSFKIPCIPCAICACLYFIYKYSFNIRCSKGWCVHNYFCTHTYQKQYNWFQKHV